MKPISMLVVSAVLILCIPLPVFADGKVFTGLDRSGFRHISQNEQRAAIKFENNVEDLVIAISYIPEEDTSALWIFPVPAKPDTVKLDVVDRFPTVRGYDPYRETDAAIWQMMMYARFTQFYPTCFEVTAGSSLRGVQLHGEVEKYGIRAEVITADSEEALIGYLKAKEKIPAGSFSDFAGYLNERYSLVVCYIDSREKLLNEFPEAEKLLKIGGRDPNERWPCLHVRFPTEKAYYPMKPTSGYGHELMKFDFYVSGYVYARPLVGNSLLGLPHPNAVDQPIRFYHKNPDARNSGDAQEDTTFFIGSKYTHLSFSAIAKEMDQDIYFPEYRSPKLRYAEILAFFNNRWGKMLCAITFAAALSYIAGGLTGLLFFKKWKSYARFALWNLLTIIGLGCAIYLSKKPHAMEMKNHRIRFLLIFFMIFMVLSVFMQLLLLTPVARIGIGMKVVPLY